MTHRQTHFLEKLEFQLTAVAAVAAVFWLAWPALIPADPELPATFLAGGGGLGRLLVLAAAAALLGVICGASTATGRPQTAAMALAVGLAGLSFRSRRIRTLLWDQQDALPAMYWMMALELVVLLVIFFAAASLTMLGRRLVAGLAPSMLWNDPLLELDEDRREEYDRVQARVEGGEITPWTPPTMLAVLKAPLGFPRDLGVKDEKLPVRENLLRGVMGFMVSILAAAIIFFLLLRSPERGQVLFSVFAGCFLGVFIGQRVSPAQTNLAAWAVPVVLGLFLYVLAAVSSVYSGRGAWLSVATYYRVLPIDWLTVGLGGAMLGHWENLRMREARYIEEAAEAEISEA